MQSRDFCFWLQGLFELNEPTELNAKQTQLIKQHLGLVFRHEIDPSMPDPTGELQAIHDGKQNTSVLLPPHKPHTPIPDHPQPPPWPTGPIKPSDQLYRC